MNLLFFDDDLRTALLPLTYTRPMAELRVGILKIAEKWQAHLKVHLNGATFKSSYLTASYLQTKFPINYSSGNQSENLYLNGAVCPNSELIHAILKLKPNESVITKDRILALRTSKKFQNFELLQHFVFSPKSHRQEIESPTIIERPWHIFQKNRAEIISDFELLTAGRKSQPITDKFTAVYGRENIFLEEGATVRASILNAENAPIYLGKNSTVSEGSIIQGAFALGENAVVNAGAKMRGDSTIGDFSKVGGEVSNSVLQGFSNKGHDGFLGNSVLGTWCNLGADTNTSNLKNNYSSVKVWDYQTENFTNTGQQFVGLLMGDHSKASINTMFNTGTVVGVGANVFGAGFHPKFVPSFSWGGQDNFDTFRFDRFIKLAQIMMQRRNQELTEGEKKLLRHIWETTQKYRS